MPRTICRFVFACLFGFAPILMAQTSVPSKATPDMFRAGYDLPAGIEHGTWDFDEWPGVDHAVVYKQNFMYASTPNEKIKIDYFLSVFDKDDHEGYLKSPEMLKERGFVDFSQLLTSTANKTMLGIFCHPDDEVLLAGGLLASAAADNWKVKVYLVSNGADGGQGQSDDPSEIVRGYNSFGVMPDGRVIVKTDATGEKKMDIIRKYADKLGVAIEVIPLDLTIEGKKVVQIGEVPGLDISKTFGAGSPYRQALYEGIARVIAETGPSIVLTHGTDGEYGNLLHKYTHDIVKEIADAQSGANPYDLYTCFPEYNFKDGISHFIDLYENNRRSLNRKWDAIRNISFLFTEGADFDKPWDPNDDLMDGVFVKDYGYTESTAEPPRYEFFHFVSTIMQ